MKKNENAVPSVLGSVIVPAVIGFAVALILMIVGVVLVQRDTIGENLIGVFSRVCLAIGCLLAGFIAVKRARTGKVLCAVVAGVILFVLFAGMSLLMVDDPVNIVHTVVSILCVLVSSFVGAMLGMTRKRTKKYKHIKK